MIRHGIRHVLVTDEETGRLEGVISERDLFSLQKVGCARSARHPARGRRRQPVPVGARHPQFAVNMLARVSVPSS